MPSSDLPALRILVPTFNEGENPLRIAQAVRDALPGAHLFFLDDASSDAVSRATLGDLASRENTCVISAPQRVGKAENLRQAFMKAAALGDAVIVLDCDLVVPGTALIALREGITNADLTVAGAIALSPPRSLTERALIYASHFHHEVRKRLRRRRPAFCVIGRAFALSPRAVQTLSHESFPAHTEDAFIALRLLQERNSIRFLSESTVYYRAPTSFEDHRKQSHRFAEGAALMRQIFGARFVADNLGPPVPDLAWSFVTTAARNPLGAALYVLLTLRTQRSKKCLIHESTGGWVTSESTKSI